jgi:hypothetical protein
MRYDPVAQAQAGVADMRLHQPLMRGNSAIIWRPSSASTK